MALSCLFETAAAVPKTVAFQATKNLFPGSGCGAVGRANFIYHQL